MTQKPAAILINLMGSLGDVSRGMSLLAPIRKSYPDCRISWLVEPKCLGLVQLSKDIDRIVLFERGSGVSAIFRLVRQLRAESYDICFDLQRHFKSAFFSRLSGAKKIIAFNRQDSKEFNWLFANEQINAMPPNMPKIEHYWEFLKHLGLDYQKTAKADLRLIAKEDLQQQLDTDLTGPYVIINTGSAWISKDWDLDKYFYLLKRLIDLSSNVKFILCGAASHKEFAASLEARLAQEGCKITNLCAGTNLAQLTSLIAYSRVVFGPDSGPGHLAAMLEIPFVGVFGPTDTDRTAPYGNNVTLLTADVTCRPCYKRVCPGLGHICMKLIEPENVRQAILRYL